MEGLRGFSALLVFFVHFQAQFGNRVEQSWPHQIFAFLAVIGNCGVDVFFALSGFLIYGLLLRKPFGYFSFVRRRIQRLYPVFTVVFLVYVSLSVALPYYSKMPASSFAAIAYLVGNFLMLPGIFPIVPLITVAWSLSYELCFYLTLPLVMRTLRVYAWRRSVRIAFWIGVCFASLALTEAGLMPHPRLIMFGAGILVREVFDIRTSAGRFGDVGAILGFIIAMALIGFKDAPVVTAFCGPIVTRSTATLGVLFTSVFALVYYTLSGTGLLARLFGWDWLRWFGNMSYSYYLVHGFVLHILSAVVVFLHLPARMSPLSFLALLVVAIGATVLGGSVVFLTIEKPSLHPGHAGAARPNTVDSRPVNSAVQ